MAERVCNLKQPGGARRRVGGQPALLDELRERPADVVPRVGCGVGARVVEQDPDARLRGNLRDAASHHAGPDDADGEILSLRVEGHARALMVAIYPAIVPPCTGREIDAS